MFALQGTCEEGSRVSDDIVVEMLSEGTAHLIPWRCLHGGPLTRETIERRERDDPMPWADLRARNVPLLRKLTRTYGACAVVARDGERVVGTLRFYPKSVAPGPFCLQQLPPNGPGHDLADAEFPPFTDLVDKTLCVHCLMTAARRAGLGTRMARELIAWAARSGWEAVEATAYEDLDIIYAITGSAGRSFWEKLGFRVIESGVEPAFDEVDVEGFTARLHEEAAARGLAPDHAKSRYLMRLELQR